MDLGFFISELRLLLSVIAEQCLVGMIICFIAIADEFFSPPARSSHKFAVCSSFGLNKFLELHR